MTTKIFTVAHLPDNLDRTWLQHVRDFDTKHPGCHFEMGVDGPFDWRRSAEYDLDECFIGDKLVAWIEPRPPYCDRGHFKMLCELPDIDAADSFPRYYMSKETAIKETEAFLRWRLWKLR